MDSNNNKYTPNSNNLNTNNSNLIDENKKLKEELSNYKRENEQLKIQIKKLNEDNNKLNNELIKANKIISNSHINQKENNNEIENLKELIKIKEKENNNLKLQLENNGTIKKSVNFDDIIIIHFISLDQAINCALKCLKSDTFVEVEEKLYQKYEQYRETNNNFVTNGRVVLRFKKIFENNIKDGDKVELINV